jgi:hypothetical protein
MILRKYQCAVCFQTYNEEPDAVRCCVKVRVVRECSYCEEVFSSAVDAEIHEAENACEEDR